MYSLCPRSCLCAEEKQGNNYCPVHTGRGVDEGSKWGHLVLTQGIREEVTVGGAGQRGERSHPHSNRGTCKGPGVGEVSMELGCREEGPST